MPGKAIIEDDGDVLKVGYEDYGVDSFGGGDCEVTYTINKENRIKLYEALTAEGYSGNLSVKIKERFGLSLEKESFSDYCIKHEVEFDKHVWIS